MARIDLSDRVALVTGASRGIGKCTALALAEAGGAVAVHFNRQADAAAAVEGEIQAQGGEAIAAGADDVRAAVAACFERGGRLDILVCNAWIWKGAAVAAMTEAQWDETIDINLKGMYLTTRYALPHLKASAVGAIVNVSSTAGQRGEAGHAHYAASKGGMIAWTKSLAPELAPYGVRVNCVAPGWVVTDMAAAALASDGEKISAGIPLGRAGQPQEVASGVCFLASDLASYMTGEIVNVNGGSVLCG